MAKFVVKKTATGFRFNLKADNGQTILTSETYTSKLACQKGVGSVRNNAKEDKNFEHKVSSNNKYYFNLKAGNGQVIGTSEMYESVAGRDAGIESVKVNAAEASVTEEA